MTRLPVIVGFGGFNAAGRSSFHQAYQRMVLESLSATDQQQTLTGLATMMGLIDWEGNQPKTQDGQPISMADIESRYGEHIRQHTLIRKIESHYFDIDNVAIRQNIQLSNTDQQALTFTLPKRKVPEVLPNGWRVLEDLGSTIKLAVENVDIGIPSSMTSPVQSAGQLPTGFDPSQLYNARFHPRGLQMAITGASDALNSVGIDWETILEHVSPDEIGAYSSAVMTQLDQNGNGGLMQSRLKGERVSSKQLALGLSSMPSDFINAYVLGNLGSTGSIAGACASFLYNLKAGIEDIQSGRCRVVMVSSSEAPILPEVIEGYSAMGALATTEKLSKILTDSAQLWTHASRPFGDNCGFVIAESTQHVILMDDELALTLGADIYGSVPTVYTSADGYKKSISAPGPGNYLCLAKTMASIRDMLGDEVVRKHSFVQAHGSSTPQNRVTESVILNQMAKTFGIESWPITAVKTFVGHSLAPASGDQLINSLGIFAHGLIPGIKTIDKIADDVAQERLSFVLKDTQPEEESKVAFLNSKGFGGNNASAAVISPNTTLQMMEKRWGASALSAYYAKRENTRESASQYNDSFIRGDYQTRYRFGENMIDEQHLNLNEDHISVDGYEKAIDLRKENLYKDMI